MVLPKSCVTLLNGFKFEINFSKAGVARIYIGNRKTKYYASGYGYDKTSAVIATMINDLIGERPYSKETYGNRNNYLCEGGVGFDSTSESFATLGDGFKLVRLYDGLQSDVYQIKFGSL